MNIEVVYAENLRNEIRTVSVPDGCTVADAIRKSGILETCPSIDLMTNKVGVFGKVMKLDEHLKDGDRVEIYRPIIADTKNAKKKRE